MKKFLVSLILLFSFILVSCDTGIKTNKYEFIKTNDFSDVVKYKDEIDLTGLYVKSTSSDYEIPANESMIETSVDTTEVGDQKLKLKFQDAEITLDIFVRYQVNFYVLGEVIDTQYVLDANEITLPADPIVEGNKFEGWDNDLTSINDNTNVNALLISNVIPKLENIEATYGDKLSDVSLPKSTIGEWSFDDPTIVLNEVGEVEFAATFKHFDENLMDVHETATVKVNKKKVDITLEEPEKNYTYNGAEQQLTYKIDGLLFGDSVDVKEENTKATNAGTYDYKFIIDSENYEGSLEGQWTINKAKVVVETKSFTIIYGENIYEEITSNLGFEIVSGEEYASGDLNIHLDDNLAYQMMSVGRYNYGVLYNENPNYDVVVNEGTVEVKQGDYPGLVLPGVQNGIYGDTLGNISITGGNVGGTWTWTNPDEVLKEVGTFEKEVIFTPNDENFKPYKGTIKITVSKKEITIEAENKEVTYDGLEHKIDYTISGILEGDKTPEIVVSSGNLDNKLSAINAGKYSATITIKSDYYELKAPVIVNLTINKATPNVTIPEGLVGLTLDKLSTVILPTDEDGTWTWKDKSIILSVGENEYLAIFTPTDTDNYNVVEKNLIVNVAKRETIIAVDSKLFVEAYTGSNLDLNAIIKATINHNETTLVYEGVFKEIGLYDVVIKSAETDNYKANELVVKVAIIDKIALETKASTYGNSISELELPTLEFAIWRWENPDYVFKTVGLVKENLILDFNDETLDDQVYSISINVAKRKVTIEAENKEVTYNGESQKIDYVINGLVEGDKAPNIIVEGDLDNTLAKTNAGTYNAVITLDSEVYYADDISVRLTINKANPNINDPEGLTGKALDSLSTVILPESENGVWSWVKADTKLSPSVNEYLAKYVPNDTNNYNIIERNIIVNVEKLDTIIEVTDEVEFIYTGNPYILKDNIDVILNRNEDVNYTFSPDSVTEENTYEVTINVLESENYKSATKTITVVVKSSDVFADKNAIYGQKLKDIAISPVTGATVRWENPEYELKEIGTFEYNLILEYEDSDKESITKAVKVTVSKKKITIVAESKEVTYDGLEHNISYEITGTLEGDEIPELIVSGDLDNTLAKTNAGVYNATLSLDSPYYYADEVKITLTINKANLEVTAPEGLTGKALDDLSTIILPESENGVWSWKNENEKLQGNKSDYLAIFTPSDIDNYSVVEVNVNISVSKLDTTISLADELFVTAYTANEINLKDVINAKLNHSETTLLYEGNYTEIGVYEVIIKSLETDNYLASEVKATLVIVDGTAINDKEATYGDALSSVSLPTLEFATWRWENPDQVIKEVGSITINLILDFNDESLEDKTFAVKFNVSKKQLNINSSDINVVYDANEHEITYSIEGLVGDDLAPEVNVEVVSGAENLDNLKATKAGTYKVILSILESEFYLGCEKEVTMTINKADVKLTINNEEVGNNKTFETYILSQDTTLTYSYTPAIEGILELKINKEDTMPAEISGEIVVPTTIAGAYEYVFSTTDENVNSVTYVITYNVYIAKVSTNTDMNAEGQGYVTLDEAINGSSEASTKTYIYVYGDTTIGTGEQEELTLGQNVELYLPHENLGGYQEYNNEAFLSGKNNDQYAILPFEQQKRYLQVTISKGYTLNVVGRITVGGNRGSSATGSANGTMGATATMYSSIVLNGDMNVSGELWVTGYIFGEGNIEVLEGGKVYEPFVVDNWDGGGNAFSTYKNVVPFDQYHMNNINVDVKINWKSEYIGIASIWTSSPAQWNSTEYPLIGTGAILEIKDGESYIEKNEFINEREEKATKFIIHGNVLDNSGELTIKVDLWIIPIEVTMSTKGLFFGLCYNFNMEVASDGNLMITNYYKMLPGSSLVVCQGGKLTITNKGKLIIYNNYTDWGYGGSSDDAVGDRAHPSYKVVGNPKFIVEGELIVQAGGAIAGNIGLTPGKNAKISLVENCSLSISSKELHKDTIERIVEETANYNGVDFEFGNYIQQNDNWVKQ